jgi:hypothetical protein
MGYGWSGRSFRFTLSHRIEQAGERARTQTALISAFILFMFTCIHCPVFVFDSAQVRKERERCSGDMDTETEAKRIESEVSKKFFTLPKPKKYWGACVFGDRRTDGQTGAYSKA